MPPDGLRNAELVLWDQPSSCFANQQHPWGHQEQFPSWRRSFCAAVVALASCNANRSTECTAQEMGWVFHHDCSGPHHTWNVHIIESVQCPQHTIRCPHCWTIIFRVGTFSTIITESTLFVVRPLARGVVVGSHVRHSPDALRFIIVHRPELEIRGCGNPTSRNGTQKDCQGSLTTFRKIPQQQPLAPSLGPEHKTMSD